MEQIRSAVYVTQQSFSDWWYHGVSVAAVNVVWVFSTVTIVFAPPALFAMIAATRELVQGRDTDVRAFIAYARAYFWLSWRWMLLNLIVVAVVNTNFLFYSRLPPLLALIMFNLTAVFAVVWFIVQFYTVPYLVWQEEAALLAALRNGFLIFLANPLFTVIVLVLGLLMLAVSILLVALFFLGGPVLIAILANQALKDRLVAYGMTTPA